MHILNLPENWQSIVAAAADLCLKPFKHSVIEQELNIDSHQSDVSKFDLILKIECRDKNGIRCPQHDIDLEIYRSGDEFNLTLFRSAKSDSPILWHGKHPVWIDGDTGKRCQPPVDNSLLESFARRLRAVLM